MSKRCSHCVSGKIMEEYIYLIEGGDDITPDIEIEYLERKCKRCGKKRLIATSMFFNLGEYKDYDEIFEPDLDYVSGVDWGSEEHVGYWINVSLLEDAMIEDTYHPDIDENSPDKEPRDYD